MNLSRFINRPVLSTVISILLVILGFIGLATLPVTQYPDIAPPTISVSATYTGANAQTVLNAVVSPLEDQINGVENMMYMTSDASNNGSASITVYFNQGTDPDMAQVNVQNRVTAAEGLLPQEVTQIGVTTRKRQSSMLMIFTIYDMEDKYNIEFIHQHHPGNQACIRRGRCLRDGCRLLHAYLAEAGRHVAVQAHPRRHQLCPGRTEH